MSIIKLESQDNLKIFSFIVRENNLIKIIESIDSKVESTIKNKKYIYKFDFLTWRGRHDE